MIAVSDRQYPPESLHPMAFWEDFKTGLWLGWIGVWSVWKRWRG